MQNISVSRCSYYKYYTNSINSETINRNTKRRKRTEICIIRKQYFFIQDSIAFILKEELDKLIN